MSNYSNIIVYGEPLHETRLDGSQGTSGAAANFAAGAKRMEAVIQDYLEDRREVRVSVLTALGDAKNDEMGNKIVEFLEGAGVDTQFVLRVPGGHSASYAITPQGFKFTGREDSAVRDLFTEKHQAFVRGCLGTVDDKTILTVCGIGASRPLDDAAFDRLVNTVEMAKKKGGTIVVDTNLRLGLWEGNTADEKVALVKKRMTRLLQSADNVFLTWPDDTMPKGGDKQPVKDAAGNPVNVYGWNSIEEAKDGLLAMGAKNVVVKMGKEGSRLYTKENPASYFEAPIEENGPFDVKVKDTTGAGDTFMAGTLMAMAHGMPMKDAMVIGTRAATQIVQHDGGVLHGDFVPTAHQLHRDLNAVLPPIPGTRIKPESVRQGGENRELNR
jgi:sugar/nucleoside kinase (ribokinase family)